jgi:uridine nucleosidase
MHELRLKLRPLWCGKPGDIMKKVIIDTDPGVDDAMAIILAFQSPDVEVVGLTTTFGNVHTPLATQNALRLTELAGYPDVPVAHGAELPLVVSLDSVADFVHGVDGLGNSNLVVAPGQPIEQPAAQFIVEMIMAYPGEITLVPIGPLTNLALALALEPRIVENVAEVVLMGGAVAVNGNVNPAAEANIYHDPHAADVVFSAGWSLTMVGLDVTMQVIMTDDYLGAFERSDLPIAQFLYKISRFYRDFHYENYGISGIHTHDPSAIAYVLDPSLFTTISGPVRVATDGIAIGQTVMDRRRRWLNQNPWTERAPVNVCVDIDAERLLALYKSRILNQGNNEKTSLYY